MRGVHNKIWEVRTKNGRLLTVHLTRRIAVLDAADELDINCEYESATECLKAYGAVVKLRSLPKEEE